MQARGGLTLWLLAVCAMTACVDTDTIRIRIHSLLGPGRSCFSAVVRRGADILVAAMRILTPIAPQYRAMALTCLSLCVRADSTGIWPPGTANVLQPLNDVVLMPPKAVPCPRCKKFRKGKGPTGNEDPCRCCSCPGLFCEHAAPGLAPHGGCQNLHSAGTTSTQCSACQAKNRIGKRKAKEEESTKQEAAAQDLVTLGNPLTGCHTAASVRPPVSVFSIYLHTSHANQHTPCPDACQTPPPARSTSLTTHPPSHDRLIAAPQSMPLSEPNSTAVAAITGGEGLVGIPLTSGGDDHVGAVNVSTTPSPAVVSPASVSSAIPALPLRLPNTDTSMFTEARDAAARAGDSWKANLFEAVHIMTTDNNFFERHLPGWRAWVDPSQDGPDMLIYRGPDGQRLNRAQFASWLQSTKVELGYASDAD